MKTLQICKFLPRALYVTGLFISLASCSTQMAEKPTIKPLAIPERLVYRLDVSKKSVSEALQGLATRFEREFGRFYIRPSTATEDRIEIINPNLATTTPYIILRVESHDDSDAPGVGNPAEEVLPVGLVVRTEDFYIQGYIDHPESETAVYYHYRDATIRDIGLPNPVVLNVKTDYVVNEQEGIDRLSVLARLRDLRNGQVTNSTSRLLAAVFAESVRFNDVRRDMIAVMAQTLGVGASLNWSSLFSLYFRNWTRYTSELRSLLSLPRSSLDIFQLARIGFLRSILFLGNVRRRDLPGASQ